MEPLIVAIDRSECIGSAQCVVVAPRVFRLDESLKAVVIDAEAEKLDLVLDAAEICPTQAIYVSRGNRPIFP